MMTIKILVFCSFVMFALGSSVQVTLEADRPSLRVQVFHKAVLECCFSASGGAVDITWIKVVQLKNGTRTGYLNMSDNRITAEKNMISGETWCGILTITEVQFSDTGFYQCSLNHTELKPPVSTHGTFLQIYKPIPKTLNLRENTKNRILVAEGILLMLCLLLPGATLLYKSKKLNELENKKKQKEEENIYEGLNLEDCSPAYDRIERTPLQDLYQDVGNCADEEIQLEKP
ncbi:B-cell antigen receptor complex-associated protein alpha chain [Lampris incognitus]|uniref:B-cell antigen receptor complex-associated protein alpha chain n=1 Tax=Lampris incognitus TaxID=2546036 RepID=UPI0024B612D8|nr:B-cell antigen receptor complex-associated protein alpha chain [Lampris incognitus]XP_056142772.1 B-cell antigen receptor complex-associated protein alpha chain [Lampris incognitus]